MNTKQAQPRECAPAAWWWRIAIGGPWSGQPSDWQGPYCSKAEAACALLSAARHDAQRSQVARRTAEYEGEVARFATSADGSAVGNPVASEPISAQFQGRYWTWQARTASGGKMRVKEFRRMARPAEMTIQVEGELPRRYPVFGVECDACGRALSDDEDCRLGWLGADLYCTSCAARLPGAFEVDPDDEHENWRQD